jgi:tryptophan synthase alpha chain
MVSPVSADRIRMVAEGAEGFLYCVSSLGVTGVRSQFNTDFDAFFKIIDSSRTIPSALGFGISDGNQIREIRRFADGVIVGSAMVRMIADAMDPDEAVMRAASFTRELRNALDG